MKPIGWNRAFSLVPAVFALIASIGTPASVGASPDIGFRLSGASYNAVARVQALSPGLEPGFRLGAEIDIASFDVFARAEEIPARAPAFLADLGVQAFWFGASAPSSDGNLYRAWRGFSASALAGLRFPAFPLGVFGASGAFHVLGGASLMSTKYTGTGLLSANPALAFRFGMDASVDNKLRWGLGLPVELAFKSGGVAVIFGLSGSVLIETGKKKP
jgi:hypothetical protein